MDGDAVLRIDKTANKLVLLAKSELADADHWERRLQDMICANPEAFWEELGEPLKLIGQEIRPSNAVADRIDILALDDTGAAVIIELKRGTHKLQLLQAISYAGMISRWGGNQFTTALSSRAQLPHEESRATIEEHVGADAESINHRQRILLIAEDFDPALLVSAEWLYENHSVDIRCYRLQLSQESGNDYLTCSCVYPPIEIESLTRHGDTVVSNRSAPPTWPEILASIDNPSVKQYFEHELTKGLDARPRYRDVIYRIHNTRRFWVCARSKYAYVRQRGRFDGDEQYWRKLLSSPVSVGQRHEGRSLRFRLETAADFAAFASALLGTLETKEFSDSPDLESSDD